MIDILGHLLVLRVTLANEQDHAQAGALAVAAQATMGDNVELARVVSASCLETSSSRVHDSL